MANPQQSGIHLTIPTETIMALLGHKATQGSSGPGTMGRADDYVKSHLGGDTGPGSQGETMGGSTTSNLATSPGSSGSPATPRKTLIGG